MGYRENFTYIKEHPKVKDIIEKWCEKQTKANNYPQGGNAWYLTVNDEREIAYIAIGWDRFPPSLIDLEQLYDNVASKPFKHIEYVDEVGFEIKYSFNVG